MKLYFLRHGLADRSEWSGPDHERPLTSQGEARMAHEADTFAELNLDLDYIYTSPLTRAYQTAEIVADRLDLSDRLIEDQRLALGFDTDDLVEILGDHPDAEGIMLVGHEPDFSETIGDLIGSAEVVCKKGSLARIDVYDWISPRGALVWLIPPKMLVL